MVLRLKVGDEVVEGLFVISEGFVRGAGGYT
jgi:hypothetical protein